MPRLLLPTRNRPAALRAVLEFLSRFHPGTELFVADGSEPSKADATQKACEEHGAALRLIYRAYPADLPLFERLLDVMLALEDECLALTADDDYPNIDVFEAAEAELLNDPDCVNVVPADVLLILHASGKLTARLSQSRPLRQSQPEKRVRHFAMWSFATTYGVTRRRVLIERYRMMSKLYCAGMIDFQIGMEDALHGTVKTLADFSAIRTQNYAHSYFRPTEPLIFLRKAERMMAIRDHWQERLVDVAELAPSAALDMANHCLSQRVAELTAGNATSRVGLQEHSSFRERNLQQQFRLFYELFEPDNPTRARYIDKLQFITDNLKIQALSSKTAQSPRNYETLDAFKGNNT